MTVWLWASAAQLALLLPCAIVALRGSPVDRLLGLQLGTIVASLAFLMLGEGFGRSVYFDLALVFTAASYVGTLAMVRLLERWV